MISPFTEVLFNIMLSSITITSFCWAFSEVRAIYREYREKRAEREKLKRAAVNYTKQISEANN